MGMVCFLPGWSLISDTTASARISAFLADISSWITAHQLKLNPSKTELLIIPATAHNLGVTMDNQLSFSSHVTNVTRSCRFLLYNIRRIWPFLSTQATQVLVQSLVISRLDYCNSLLAGLPLNAIRPLQMIQNAAARLVFNLPKFSHTTPLLRSLHWLPVATHIRFKTLMLAYKAKNGPAPSYLKALITPRTAPHSLRSTNTARLVPPSLREKEQTVVDFAKRKEHRVTYKRGGRSTQVGYILCRRGSLKEIGDCKVVVGESVARQHWVVVCRMTLMVCKKKRSGIEKKTKWWKLKKEECCEGFRQKLRQALGGQVVLPDDWETTAEVIRETGRKVLGVSSGRRKEDKETWWWNEEVQDSVQRKRLAKKKWDMDRTEENKQEYKELQHRVKIEVSKAKHMMNCTLDLEKAYDTVPRKELWYCLGKSGVAEKYVRVVQDIETREQVEENLERWRFALERRGMKVSRSKTEYMCVNEREGSGTVRLQGEEEKVEEFKYLGSTVQSNGECGKELFCEFAFR
ncbi:hypothetical protein QTP86_010913 [Hemibagrus guttatus]|nr:hypothetical protein QTP86_010913 [Hemibagrus guttatus]